MILDAFGPRTASQIGSSMFALGFILLTVSVVTGIDLFMPAFVILGIIGTMLLHPLFSLSQLFPESPGTVLAVLNGCFDASAVVFLIMGAMVQSGIPFSTVLIAYLCGPVLVILVLSLVLWPPRPYRTPGADADGKIYVLDDGSASASAGLADATSVSTAASKALGHGAASSGSPKGNHGALQTSSIAAGSATGVHTALESEGSVQQSTPRPVSGAGTPASDGKSTVELAALRPVPEAGELASDDGVATADNGKDVTPEPAKPGIVSQILTVEFMALMAFVTLHFLRFNTYLGSLDAQLAALARSDDDKIALLQAFGVILPVGAVTVIIAGQTVDRLGITAAAAALAVLGVLVNGFAMIPVPEAQYATFICFATFRAFLFTFLTNYVARRYGFGLVGRMLGVISVLGGIVSFLQYPLLSVALAQSPVSFDIPNGILLGCGIVSLAYPVYLARKHGAMMPGKPGCA